MNNLWIKIKLWTKSAVVLILVVYIISFIVKNGGQTVGFWYWFFADTVNTSLLTFTFLTFLFGVVATLMVRTVFKTLRQFRKMRKENQVNRLVKENAEMRSKAAMLQTRTDTPTENQADQT
ncbi:MAG: hypothetical protein IT448_04905 [Phycisphaerales bacterium]|nr:hypothetical protein [Phycisphaerales bacterium]